MTTINTFDTIVAIATPIGTGGVGVIRISGDDSFYITKKIFYGQPIYPGQIAHGWIKDDDGNKIDEVIILAFAKPHSFTGEDVIEIQCHGGVNVLRNILDLILQNGARIADRGEFSKRAFLNNKIDLSRAEAVADLIHAKTQNFAKKSANNLSGALFHEIQELKKQLFISLSLIVASLDFPDDIRDPNYDLLKIEFNKLLKEIDRVLVCAKSSDILRQGIKVAIVGRPNVGKSSLFNKLLNVNRAIVTDVAGTTRDVLTETLDMDVAVTLIDTAGIRDTEDVGKVEGIGIEFSKQSARDADLILFIYDSASGLTKEDKEIYDLIKDKKHLIIANKCDLIEKRRDKKAIYISTLTGEGIDKLREKIKTNVYNFTNEETEFVINKRQEKCFSKARECLVRALEGIDRHELLDLISIDVRDTLAAFNEVIGESITEEILDNVFSNFCIGK